MTGLPREGLRPGASSPALSSLEELPVRYARGVGPARAQLLERLGVRTVAELLYRLPRRLEDRSHLRPIAQLAGGTTDTVQGMVSRVTQFRPRRRRDLVLVKAAVTDGTGVLQAVWYNQPYLARQLPVGGRVILHGRVVRRGGEVQMVSPEFEVVEDGEDAETLHAGRIVPVYGSTEGLSQRTLRGIVARALDDHAGSVEEWMPAEILAHYGFPSLGEALREAHFPQSLPSWETARNRLVFEELLLFQLLVLRQRAAWTAETRAVPYGDAGPLLARFLGSLPYRLTAAQRRVLGEILRDLDGPHPMNRLLQGDVGSGKTVVAAAALLRAVGGGAQGALMAPTEILAEQHYLTLRRLLEPLGVTVQLLVGSLPRAERQAALRRKGERPDVLVMTATPIPRTLALTLYGDLDVSVLDELPPGRSPIRTVHRAGQLRPKVYEFVRAQVAQGRQAYIVCPLIEESDKLQAEAATELASRLREGPLRGLRVEVVHGRLRVEERDRVMEALRAGEIDVLVATTVIEVGIDVPNATVMVIEDADRFGLAQLHQLRGRVGRGAHQSYCILVADPRTEEARARLRVMVETTDGFQIAQRDLELRGVGELRGGRRQHGISDFRVADLLRDHRWVERAREEALRIVAQDPALGRPEHRGLALALRARFGAAPAENAQVG